MINRAKSLFTAEPPMQQLLAEAKSAIAGNVVNVTGLSGSLRALAVGLLAEQNGRQILLVAPDGASAQRFRDDLHYVIGSPNVRVFSGSPIHVSPDESTASGVEDVETLRSLMDGDVKIALTHASAIATPVPNPSHLKHQVLKVEAGKEYGFSDFLDKLSSFGFEKKQFVEATGDYSVRGGILDVFPYVGDNPIRIEFFGDSVESIREFDPLSQRSITELSTASIVPDLLSAAKSDAETTPSSSLVDFLCDDALIVIDEPDLVKGELEGKKAGARNRFDWAELNEMLSMFPQLHIRQIPQNISTTLDFGSTSQPAMNGSVKVLRSFLSDLQAKEYLLYIACDTEAEQNRLKDLLADLEPIAEDEERREHLEQHHLDVSQIKFSLEALHEGFLLHDTRLAVLTEHQVFNRFKRRGKRPRTKFKGISQKDLHELRRGDYVVHADYGIGRYDGLKKIKVKETEQEVVKLLYEEKDTLYVNLNYVTKIQKYASKEGHIPRLTRLGSGEWEKLRQRAKKRVKDIARDLIKLYATRKHTEGFAFQKDTLWQRELEASFMYEDTPDQAKATSDIKQDMEAPFPMDRLVCGDVGFGKTEVAVRASFKAVMNGKQVAVLVPTTILAEQHHNTFLDRLGKYSTRLDVLSRFKTKKQQIEILERLKAGATDIVIGTHRLLSKDVQFKDLGLLIIDEEHRFGVAAKEKLRQLRSNVDTLTLTATPIPRTLHFSLMGARDLSIIATPPPNRLPVITEIRQYEEDHFREAILRETHRGGQVSFVHDRVHNMDELIDRLQSILPDVRFRQAHGQMHAHELEDVMVAFLEKKFDVLVATKIIESGIDIPSVNTIIINRADRFGMAELYQLRGRVGRSNIQAYAHLLTPPISVLPREAVRRLQAIEEFTELGSGFNLAMRDLEIRGAGNLLGGEQSGFIESMGFEMYTKILEEAVSELKEQEFRDLFDKQEVRREEKSLSVVETDFDVRIPESYVEDDNERLTLYRRIFAVNKESMLEEITAELADRFGKHPHEVENLINLVRIRLKASRLGFRKVNISSDAVTIEFPPESETQFYEGEAFQLLMAHISQQKSRRTALRQNGKTLQLTHLFDIEEISQQFKQTEDLMDELEGAVNIAKSEVSAATT